MYSSTHMFQNLKRACRNFNFSLFLKFQYNWSLKSHEILIRLIQMDESILHVQPIKKSFYCALVTKNQDFSGSAILLNYILEFQLKFEYSATKIIFTKTYVQKWGTFAKILSRPSYRRFGFAFSKPKAMLFVFG